jgi:hypothetical protein
MVHQVKPVALRAVLLPQLSTSMPPLCNRPGTFSLRGCTRPGFTLHLHKQARMRGSMPRKTCLTNSREGQFSSSVFSVGRPNVIPSVVLLPVSTWHSQRRSFGESARNFFSNTSIASCTKANFALSTRRSPTFDSRAVTVADPSCGTVDIRSTQAKSLCQTLKVCYSCDVRVVYLVHTVCTLLRV